jgi:hypothetical protein
MSVPTISSVTPSSGRSTGRNLVKIIGTGFRVPPPPPPTGYLGGEQQKTVSVKFAGVESEWAYAASSTIIFATVPTWAGAYDVAWPISVSVRVANLSDGGVEITGENATKTTGYSYARPALAVECYLQRVLREFVKIFRRHLGVPVWLTVDVDYTDSPADQDRLRAVAPVIHLVGPSGPLNRFDSLNREEAVDDPTDPNGWLRRLESVAEDLVFEIRCYAPTSRQLFALGQAFTLFQRDIVEMRIPDDPAVPTGAAKTYELKCPFDGLPDYNTEPVAAGLFAWSGRFMIIGVQIDDEGGTIIQRGWRTTANDGEPTTDVQPDV